MVAVVAAVRGQVEGDAQAHLPCSEVAAVEGVARFSRAETRVLPDGPRTDGVHAAVGAAQVGRDSGGVVQVLELLGVDGRVEGLEGDLFAVGDVGHGLRATGCGLVGGQARGPQPEARGHLVKQRCRQRLHRVAPADRVGHTAQEALVAQQVVDVANDTSSQRIAFGQGRRGDGETIAATGDRGHGLERGADQVLVCGLRFGRVGDDGLYPRVVRAVVLGLELIHHGGPGLAEGAQTGHFVEEVIAEVQSELEAGTGVVDGIALVQQALQEHPALLKGFLRVPRRAVAHAEEADARVLGDTVLQFADVRIVWQAQAEAEVGGRHLLFSGALQQQAQGAVLTVHLQVDTREEHIDQYRRQVCQVTVDLDRIGTAHQAFQELVVGVGIAGVHTDGGPPGVAFTLHTAASASACTSFPGHVEGGQLGALHLHEQRGQFLVLQFLLDHGLPLLARGGGEGGEESFSGHRREDRGRSDAVIRADTHL